MPAPERSDTSCSDESPPQITAIVRFMRLLIYILCIGNQWAKLQNNFVLPALLPKFLPRGVCILRNGSGPTKGNDDFPAFSETGTPHAKYAITLQSISLCNAISLILQCKIVNLYSEKLSMPQYDSTQTFVHQYYTQLSDILYHQNFSELL